MDNSNAEQRQVPSATPQVIQSTQHGVHQEIIGRTMICMKMYRSITKEAGTRESVITSDSSFDADQPTENATADSPVLPADELTDNPISAPTVLPADENIVPTEAIERSASPHSTHTGSTKIRPDPMSPRDVPVPYASIPITLESSFTFCSPTKRTRKRVVDRSCK